LQVGERKIIMKLVETLSANMDETLTRLEFSVE